MQSREKKRIESQKKNHQGRSERIQAGFWFRSCFQLFSQRQIKAEILIYVTFYTLILFLQHFCHGVHFDCWAQFCCSMVPTQLTLPPFYSPLKTHSHAHIHNRVAEAPMQHTTCSSGVISTRTHSDEWIYIVKRPTGDIWGSVSWPGTLQHVDCGGHGSNRTLWLGWAVAHLLSFSPNQNNIFFHKLSSFTKLE